MVCVGGMLMARGAAAADAREVFRWPEGTYRPVACDELDVARVLHKHIGVPENGLKASPPDIVQKWDMETVSGWKFSMYVHRLATDRSEWNMSIRADSGRERDRAAAAAKLAEITGEFDGVVASCEAAQRAKVAAAQEAALAPKRDEAFRAYRTQCYDVVMAIPTSDLRAIAKVDTTALTKTCQDLVDATGKTGRTTEQSALLTSEAGTLSQKLTRISVIQKAVRILEDCMEAPYGTRWTGTRPKFTLNTDGLSNARLVEVANQLTDADKACAANVEWLGSAEFAQAASDLPSTIFDTLPSGRSIDDLSAIQLARNAAMKRLVPVVIEETGRALVQAAWEAEHCRIICACESGAPERTVNWGEACPGRGKDGCWEYDRWGGKTERYWRPTGKDCR